MIQELKQYHLGDMKLIYYMDTDTYQVGMYLLPYGMVPLDFSKKAQEVDSIVQIKYTGDTYLGGYAGGNTLRQSESVKKLKYKNQLEQEYSDHKEIVTWLTDERGYIIKHYVRWYQEESIEVYAEFENHSAEPVMLELFSSFSMGGLTPFIEGDAHDSLQAYRIRSVWSMEGRVEKRSIEELQLEPAWATHAVRCERFGQIGSMPVNGYFPFLAIEDTRNQVVWGAQIAHNASWQMEIYRKDDGLSISGGLADRDFGHWMKKVEPKQSFMTPKAVVSVCIGGSVDNVSQRLTRAGKKYISQMPKWEEELPIIFNEYCTTWGCPSDENIRKIIQVIKEKGFSYFVIDCGWYKEKGVPWDISMGDYEVSEDLFPNGMEDTIEMIRSAGLKPGIWFEIDNVGSASRAYHKEEHLLHRDEQVLTTTMRRFWDMRQEWVEEYLTQKVIKMIKKYKIEYVKMDYNDSIGVGCDGAESLGEGLRQNMQASLQFIRKIKQEVPEIILENCASGGHKLEPLMMSECSMASFSDAHECEEIPIIAANLHRTILPSQSQIWCVLRKEDSAKRIAYSLINTFLGRMCISGDVIELTKDTWDLVERGMKFYRKIAPIIKEGTTYFYGSGLSAYRHPEGWQGILRTGNQEEAYVIIHTFHGIIPPIEIDLRDSYEIVDCYSDSRADLKIKENILIYNTEEPMKAVAVLLKKLF